MQTSSANSRHGSPVVYSKNVTVAVYAPFGTDVTLSTFPDGTTRSLATHPLVSNLQRVAASGAGVSALVDIFEDDTYRVDIPASHPELMTITSVGKLSMDDAMTLSNHIAHAHAISVDSALLLTIEGHGAGFLPDLDKAELTLDKVTAEGRYEWRLGSGITNVFDTPSGEAVVARGAPVLPIGNPTCPTNHLALSTPGYAEALSTAKAAGIPKLSVIHFNNCFNMSVEVLHTVAPYAEFATGYCNYNFFTAGQAYPAVFERLAAAGSATSEELAKWFAAENHKVLLEAGHEPTVAGTVDLARMHGIVEKVDDLADALLAALRTASDSERPIVVGKIRDAIIASQQYDSRPDFVLDTPDELTDLDSLAYELAQVDFGPFKVAQAASALREALRGIKQYGDVGTPWMAPGDLWDFSSKNLAMNIFLPDPLLKGLWDWRSQYYLDVNPDPNKPQVQRNIIDFVKVTDWVDFLIEYHKETPFVGLLPALIPEMPVLRSTFNPRCPGVPRALRHHPVVDHRKA